EFLTYMNVCPGLRRAERTVVRDACRGYRSRATRLARRVAQARPPVGFVRETGGPEFLCLLTDRRLGVMPTKAARFPLARRIDRQNRPTARSRSRLTRPSSRWSVAKGSRRQV